MAIDYLLAKLIKEHAPKAPFTIATLGRLNWHLTRRENRKLFGEDDARLPAYREYSESFFAKLGAQAESFDISPMEQPTHVVDFNLPLDPKYHNRFDMVVDGGTIEHVFDAPQAVRNVISMLRVGGVFLAQSPVNGYAGHGCYQFSPEFWRMAFAHAGGHTICEMYVQTLGNLRLQRLPLKDPERTEWVSFRPQCLLVVARKQDVAYAPPVCQADYAEWIATGVNPTYHPTPNWKRFILERSPVFSHWIESWLIAFNSRKVAKTDSSRLRQPYGR